ncbi:hypothetical protein Slin15195_G030300 [Septoria linicola]|uniref:Uncharacterized protein n=1 Tax=Septoria linicola TaxID=215465 RepID=A0A9Q9EFF5_9PEZI|nr:hypothetical protein Slin14017_G029320 [Septoria linicola]USW49711.1 hypothetical protein Slin15195_G030300 [Septoria linicola]
MLRNLIRLLWRIVKWPFLLTLPVTLLPLLIAMLDGIVYAFWNNAYVGENIDKFLYEAKDNLGDWGVGKGVPSFRQFQDTHNDFHTMRINSNDFLEKLGFILPEQYSEESGIPTEDLPIDKYADIENIVRDISTEARCGKPEKPREQWVFLTYHGFRFFHWDEDFIYAINYAQGDRKLNQTGLYFAQCTGTAGFLCGVWGTRSPALVHFLVEDEPLDEDALAEAGLSYAPDHSNLRPVTARIIEFPLKEAYTGLPWTTFPTFQNQMLSMMTGDRLYEQFEPYHPMQQMMVRFGEHMNKHYWDNKSHFLFYVSELDNWMQDHVTEPLGIEEGLRFLHTLVFILTGNAVRAFVVAPFNLVTEIIGMFLGKPLRGDAILGDVGLEHNGEPENILDGLFGGIMADVVAGAEKWSSKSVASSVSGSGPFAAAATP